MAKDDAAFTAAQKKAIDDYKGMAYIMNGEAGFLESLKWIFHIIERPPSAMISVPVM
jgi:hypothetical protein